MKLKTKNILITGGKGFIGLHLCKKLSSLGANVSVYDLSQGDDINDEIGLKRFIKKKFDAIYHLAGYSGSSESNDNVEKSFVVNALGTENILNLTSQYSPSTKIVISSSRLEYGTPEYLPVDEKHPTNPISAYGLSKLVASQMARIYANSKNLDITTFRTSNVYGRYEFSNFAGYNVINHFINLAGQRKDIVIFGKGAQIRDYIHVDDLVSAFLKPLSKDTSGEIYNLGYGKGISLRKMTELIVKISGKGKILFKKWPEKYSRVETGDYISDISKLTKDTGFVPKVNFEQGIRKTIS